MMRPSATERDLTGAMLLKVLHKEYKLANMVYIMTLYTNILSNGNIHIFWRIFSRYMGNRT